MSNEIELLEYNDALAPGIKDMWDNSVKHWNGESHITTVERIINQENSSSHIHLTLARFGEQIAGYCKLSIDHNDTNALYIDKLNVRDDYQGKKIGKKLVLDALKKTTSLGWQRLHLNTWPGNVKAVPLYKKCGFFWEKRDDTTHLINLIPKVLKCELFKDYFESVDWYDDSKREIKIEPDGKLENNFNIWEYSWEKNNNKLKVEFTRRGRGIKKVETNDYIIEALVENLVLVYGQSYTVKYKIVNKSGKELNIKLNGLDDKNIKFDFNRSVKVISELELLGDFYVGEINSIQTEWKTHPSVTTNIEVNGKSAIFKTGIIPKAPLSIDLVCEDIKDVALSRGNHCKYYLNVHNNHWEVVQYSFSLPKSEFATFSQEDFNITLNPLEKKSIPVYIGISRSLFYVEQLNVLADFNSKLTYEFDIEIKQVFNLGYGSYIGESRNSLEVGMGGFSLNLDKTNNKIIFKSLFKSASQTILPGTIGYPFNGEFEKKQFSKYSYTEGDGCIILKIYYESDTYNNISLIRNLKLYENGILDRWFRVTSSNDDFDQDFYINDKMEIEESPSKFCYNNSIVSLDYENSYSLECWKSELFTENWIFFNVEDSNIGLSWSKGYKLKIVNDAISLITPIGKLHQGTQIDTEVITTTFNTLDDWNQFRAFSLKRRSPKDLYYKNIDFIINDRNPFLYNKGTMTVKSLNGSKLNGRVEYSIGGLEYNFSLEDTLKNEINFPLNKRALSVNIKYNSGSTTIMDNQTLFLKGKSVVSLIKENSVFTIDNGVLTVKANMEFAPSIFSLKYMGNEWLDSNYPEVDSKSWWNPWCGGLMSIPDGLSLNSLLEEKITMEFVERKDNKGNSWSGIKISAEIVKDSGNKGFIYSQYYLTQPEVPVIMYYNEYSKKGEFSKQTFVYNNFFKSKKHISDLIFRYTNNKGKLSTANGGSDGLSGSCKGQLVLSNKNTNESLINLCDTDDSKGYYLNRDITMVWVVNTATATSESIGRTNPNFIVFSEDELKEGSLDNLQYLRIV